MSAVLDYEQLKRMRRRPFDEVMPDGTPAAQVLRLPTDGNGMEGAALAPRSAVDDPLVLEPPSPALRPRFATPPPPVAPADLLTGNTVAATVNPPDLTHPDPRIGTVGAAPALAEKRIGVVGMDVDPRTAGLGERPRVDDPLEYRRRRVEEMEVEPKAADRNGGWRSAGLGALRGFLRGFGQTGSLAGGVGGAATGALTYGFKPSLDERDDQARDLGRERESYGRLLAMGKARTDLEGDVLSNEVKAAQIPYLLAKPALEERKVGNKESYDAWRMASGDRKQDSAESYITWRMVNGDRRAMTAEGQLELRREWQREIQPAQFDRRMDETERNNRVNNALGGERVRQGDERIGLAREGLTLRERIAAGNLDAAWARIGQGYNRMDADRQKQVDALAAKAVKAQAEADYFAGQSGKEAEVKLKRAEAEGYRRQAEGISSRQPPRVSRSSTQPSIQPSTGRGWGEDSDVRAYADAHFGGDYGAAQMAIEEQRKRRQ